MAQSCETCPLQKRKMFKELTRDEERFMNRFKVGELTVDPGTPILMEGSNSPQLYTVLEGMGLRHKSTQNGDRQVLNFIFPGDFIGMQAGIMGEMGHSVEATTRMRLCVFDRSNIWALYKSHPSRAYDLTWIAAAEEHFMGETLLTVGQRPAEAKIAWAILRIFQRGRAVGLVRNDAMPLPYRQHDLADALGLSLVHTNKTLARLRTRQLMNWSEGTLTVHDVNGLAEAAGSEIEQERPRPIL
jgi:CRP-like cAMP-binding protein